MPTGKNVDSIFRIKSLKSTDLSFSIAPTSWGGGLKVRLQNFNPKTSTYRKLISFFLVFTMFFQLIAGIFLYSPINNAEASYNDSWYNTSWSYRKPITIDHTKIPHTDTNNANAYLSNFPVLISITDDSALIFAPDGKVQKEDGSDIIFTLPDKTPLNYEIESYDKTSGKLTAWVKVPQLNDANSSSDTAIYMYYGNPDTIANTTANINSVWDSNFKMVQHMNQDPGSATAPQMIDSTSNANNATSRGAMPVEAPYASKTDGQIGGATSFDGVDDYVDAGSKTSIRIAEDITIGAWVYFDKEVILQGYGRIIDRGHNYRIYTRPSGSLQFDLFDADDVGHSLVTLKKDFLENNWYYIVAKYNSSSMSLYVNGNFDNSRLDVFSLNSSISDSVKIAGGVSTYYLDGSLDEVRISDTARSADWIKTEYNNQSSPSNFCTSGPEENSSSPYLTEATPISTSTINSAPSYTFNSTKPGTITYGGDCASTTTSAVAGNNTVTFNTLTAGLHSNCTIQVKNVIGDSNILPITSFTVNTSITTYVVPAITDNKILPKSSIDSSYISDTISAQASPSEYKALSFVVNSNVNIADLRVEASDLTGNGNVIANTAVDIKAVKCWYQGGNGINTKVSGRYLTPELLLKDDSLVSVVEDDWTRWDVSNPDGKNILNLNNGSSIDISRDTPASSSYIAIADRPFQDAINLQPVYLPAYYNKQFWITLHIPDSAIASNYYGTISLKSRDETLKSLNLNVQVLPINLPEPNIEYSIYHRSIIYGQGGIGSGNKTEEQYVAEQVDKREHGVTNSTISFSNNNLIQEISIRQEAGANITNMYNVSGALDHASISYYKNLLASYGVENIYLYGADETSLDNQTDRAWIADVHNAGGLVYDSQSIAQADSVADVLDLAIVGEAPSSVLAAKYHSFGHKVYSYGNPQAVPEYPKLFRINYGLALWQADYDGAMDYAYQASMGDIWNDFDYSYRDHVFAYPTINGVVDTVQWEGFREG